MKRVRPLLTIVALLAAAFLVVPALSQTHDGQHDGQYGVGHDTWHDTFYSKLVRSDTKTSCCSNVDCRPTESRMTGDHYEVKVDGAWTPVPKETILHIQAPDGGAHVCAPKQIGANRGVIYCVILPPET